MKSPLQDFFDFSRGEQKGLMFLVVIICSCLVVMNFHQVLFPIEIEDTTAKEKEILIALNTEREKKEKEYSEKYSKPKSSGKKRLADPFEFDPNHIDKEGLISLGFSAKQATSIIKYRGYGDGFATAEDFKSVYVVNDYMYNRLKDFIVINPIVKKESLSQDNSKDTMDAMVSPLTEEREIVVVEINTATAEELMSIRGIGPIYAERILKYKELLGGYSDPSQLNEVYGLDKNPEIVSQILPFIEVNSGHCSKIDINSADWKELTAHMYIEPKVANSIIAMREVHGNYLQIEDVLRSHFIDDSLFFKLKPYLKVAD